MARQFTTLLVCIFLHVTQSANEVSDAKLLNKLSVQSMARTFARSEKVHQESMMSISSRLSLRNSVELLRKSRKLTPALAEVTNMVLGGHTHLRKQPKGYSGVDGARKLLNDMIFEALTKYDAEIAKCTDYYSKQCAAMEVCRGQISGANYIAANSRSLILDAQANINRCQVEIPTRKYELAQHLLKCKAELYKMNSRLKIVMGDIAVMTMILEMTDCDKSLLQTTQLLMLQCLDQCTNKTFVTFDHAALNKKLSLLKSTFANNLLEDTFKDLFAGIESMESIDFLQLMSEEEPGQPFNINKTQFNNPPVPITKVPGNPCNDKYQGAPSPNDKRAAKCTIKKSPQCYKLQERFLLIQAGIEDERDELMEEIDMLKNYCEETKKTIETQIEDDETVLEESQTKLGVATEKEATAGETARQTAIENDQLNSDLIKQMKTCSNNYINAETELCALKKIRGELYKLKGTASPFFQDCEVSKWDPEECTKICSGGEQKLTRNVLTHPDGGAKCLPLAAMRSCNNHPCPVDCGLAAWSGWSKCSAECGGGVTQRLREVKTAAMYGGHPCGATSQTKSCSPQACEKDCELSDWTKWSACSKDCDGGTKKRVKFITHEAEGAGKCADEWSIKRLQYHNCNMIRCRTLSASQPLACNRTLDVILLLDGSGSLGKQGWEAEIYAAKLFIGAFKAAGKVQMSVILFSGPKTWGKVSKCTGKSQATVSLEECGIKTVSHFTDNLNKIDQLVTGLDWPMGSTLTSLALMTAKAEMALGRADEHTIVVVFTDGRPMSLRKTRMASREIRKAARLVWIPVTKFAPLKQVKKWATRRWQENVIPVSDFTELHKPDVVTHIIADICPKQDPVLKFKRR